MQKQILKLNDTLIYAANGRDDVDLPLTGYITHIDFLIKFNITSAASVTPAEDGILRLIKSMTIKASAGKVFFDVTQDVRHWYFMMLKKYLGTLRLDPLPPVSQTNVDVYCLIPYHSGYYPHDRYDSSLPIPAEDLTNFKCEASFGAAADLGTGFTVNSGSIGLTIFQLVRDENESKFDLFPGGIRVPRVESREKSIGSTYSNLSLEEQLPTGQLLRESSIMVLNSAGNRTNADITEMGLKFTKKIDQVPMREGWFDRVVAERVMYGIPPGVNIDGTSLLLYNEIDNNPYGVDLQGQQIGDTVLGFTVSNSGGKLRFLHMGIAG